MYRFSSNTIPFPRHPAAVERIRPAVRKQAVADTFVLFQQDLGDAERLAASWFRPLFSAQPLPQGPFHPFQRDRAESFFPGFKDR